LSPLADVNVLSEQSLLAFWQAPQMAVNLVIFLNLLGALVLGLIVGYERSYHGRAAGMRTYGIVCMASAALTVFAGYPEHWYGGHAAATAVADPTRLVQGIVTGIGFLGAGVILKEGLNIRGLTTAASIWAASAIGVLVGVGFYAAAMLLTALSSALMLWGPRVEQLLPHRPALHVVLRFAPDACPSAQAVVAAANRWGYDVALDSLAVQRDATAMEWRFLAMARDPQRTTSVPTLALELMNIPGVASYQLSPARN
jgi:putative Mg2+ transporter-C (MgtC) family protein